jgi:putative chitinase
MTDQMRTLLLQAFEKHHIAPDLRAGIAAICGGESELKPVRELSYAHTDSTRLKGLFSRLSSLSVPQVDELKKDDHAFFEHVYGGRFGNDQPGDGYKYRGGGINQETFKGNYRADGEAIGVDLVGNPDLILAPAIAVEVAVVYMLRNYKGGGWDAMKAAVGNSIGGPDQRKNQLYAQYSKSGEWNTTATAPAQPPQDSVAGGQVEQPAAPATVTGGASAPIVPAVPMEPLEGLRRIQRIMIACGVYLNADGSPRKVDADFRRNSVASLDALVKAAGQPSIFSYEKED